MRKTHQHLPAPPCPRDSCQPVSPDRSAAPIAPATPSPREKTATSDQRRALRILIVQAQLSDAEVERLLMARFSRPAVTKLSYGQAASLLRELQRKLRQRNQTM